MSARTSQITTTATVVVAAHPRIPSLRKSRLRYDHALAYDAIGKVRPHMPILKDLGLREIIAELAWTSQNVACARKKRERRMPSQWITSAVDSNVPWGSGGGED